MKGIRLICALLVSGLLWGASGRAEACPSCAALDPSIAAPGTESVGLHSYRVGVDLRVRSFQENGTQVEERRVGFSASFAPTDRLAVEMNWQFAHQDLQAANLAELRRLSFADPYLGVRVIAFRSRRIAPDHMLSLRAGVMAPLGSSRENASVVGAQDADLGIGTFGGLMSMAYRFATETNSLNVSASLQVLGPELVGLASASWLHQLSDAAALDMGMSGQTPLYGEGSRAWMMHIGMWLRFRRGLVGSRIAVPLAGDLGAIFQLEVMVGG